MDDLEFRRILYVDPNCKDKAVLDAAEQDPKKQAFLKEMRQLNKAMDEASQVEVPKDLANKLILRQTMLCHRTAKKRSRVQLALAASIAFVMGISFTMWQQQSNILNLSDNAIAHVVAEGNYALGAQKNISVAQVNAKLASFGAELSENVGQIYYANFCDFDNVRSLHMVMQVGDEKVTVFVLPHKDHYDYSENKKDSRYHSETVEHQRASLIVVGEAGTDVSKAKATLKEKFIFEA